MEAKKRSVAYKIKKGVIDDMMVEYETRKNANEKGMKGSMAYLQERMYEKWQERWNASEKGRVTYEFISKVNDIREKEWFDPSLYVCYLMTGHGSLNKFLYDRKLGEDAICDCGKANEDWKHVLIECELYEDVRNLSEMGIRMDGNTAKVNGCMDMEKHFRKLSEFARVVFERRKTRSE